MYLYNLKLNSGRSVVNEMLFIFMALSPIAAETKQQFPSLLTGHLLIFQESIILSSFSNEVLAELKATKEKATDRWHKWKKIVSQN